MNSPAPATDGISTQAAQELLTALTALRNGDFSARFSPTSQTGIEVQIAQTFNEIGEMLSVFSPEVRRLMREVGTEGKFGPQAEVPNAQGEWGVLVSDINLMSLNLTNQVRNFAQITTEIARGNLTQKVTVGTQGEMNEWMLTVNVMVDQLNTFASELTRLVREVGTEGKYGGQMEVRGTMGTWQDLITNVNTMSENLTNQLRSITQVLEGIAAGDTSKRLTLELRGEMAQLNAALEKVRAKVAAQSGVST